MRYLDFVDLSYDVKETDVVGDFYVEPKGVSMAEAAGGVAAESSVGTWTELTTTQPYIQSLAARVFRIEGHNVRIAYPLALFEQGNLPNILSSVAGNVFGLKTLANLRLNDVHLPSGITRSFLGPKYGINGVRKLLKVYNRPLVGTIIKPKL